MLNVVMLNHCAECHYTECRYAECRYAECRGALPSFKVGQFQCQAQGRGLSPVPFR